MPNSIQALLFDLDDTLYSRNVAFRSWILAFARDELRFAEDDPRYQETVERIIELDAWGYTPGRVVGEQNKQGERHIHAPESAVPCQLVGQAHNLPSLCPRKRSTSVAG